MDRVLYIVSAEHEKGTYIPPHQHECFELVYYLEGLGTTNIGARSYHFRPGTFALIPPDHKHDENHSEDAAVLFVGFNAASAGLAALSGVYEDDREEMVKHTMQRMKEEFSRKREGFAELMNLQMSEITLHLLRLLGTGSLPVPSEDRIQFVMNYMNEHYRHKLSVETLSEMSGYSYDRFRHIFKERYGLSPLRYLLLKRLDYAKSLLQHTQMHISEIASEAGFVNDAQFCNMFKRETGQTPRGFRTGRRPG